MAADRKGAVMIPRINLDTHLLLTSYRTPFMVGVSPSQQAWLLYSSGFEYMRMFGPRRKASRCRSPTSPTALGRMIGIDADGTAFLCGFARGRSLLECRAVRLDSGTVLWKTELDTRAEPVGGALVEGRLYVAVEDGKLFAIGR
jgi:hypothetical protein